MPASRSPRIAQAKVWLNHRNVRSPVCCLTDSSTIMGRHISRISKELCVMDPVTCDFPVVEQNTWMGWTSSSLALTIRHKTCKTAFLIASGIILLFQDAAFPSGFPLQVTWMSSGYPSNPGSLKERYSFCVKWRTNSCSLCARMGIRIWAASPGDWI